MPTIILNTGTDTDALSNLKFSTVPAFGAILNMWVSSVTSGDTWGISIGDRDIVVQGSQCNVEIAADVVDIQRDQLVFDEVVSGGQLFLPVIATTQLRAVLALRYLTPG